MGSKQLGESDSPSASSLFLPLRRRTGSVVSVASQVDKETLNQALDTIHNAASQSESLTTFNEFTSPPPSSATSDVKAITSDLQGGLSGLYSRLRASVGASKDQSSTSLEWNDDTSSTKSSKLTSSTPNLAASRHGGAKSVQTTSPAPASPAFSRDYQFPETSADSQHSISSVSQRLEPSQNRSRVDTDASLATAPAADSTPTPKAKKPSLGKSRTSLGPTTRKIAEPTVAGVTVNATKNGNGYGPEVEDNPPTVPSSPLLSKSGKPKLGSASGRMNTASAAASKATSILSRKTPVATPSDLASPSEHSEGGSYFGDDAGKALNDLHESKEPEDQFHHSSAESSRDATTKVKEPSKHNLVHSKTKAAPIVHQSDESIAARELSRRRLADLHVSRTSSTETTGVDTPARSNPFRQIGSDEEALHTIGRLPLKGKPSARSENNGRGLNVVLSQIKNRVLSKEYWMRDENAKDCFYCGDPFSTFRRKHHCRTCGQIFDAKCTVLISGAPFGQSGTLRVCKPCQGIINGSDDSSEFSDDGSIIGHGFRPRHGSTGPGDISPARSFSSLRTAYTEGKGDAIPTMAIPATRKLKDDSKKRPDVLEIEAEPKSQLTRPGSSRSLKSQSGFRPHTSHRRHHSRSILGRGARPSINDIAPFHRPAAEGQQGESRLPAFHSDNVIDPELADFMSDEDSSADEQPSIGALMSGDVPQSADTDRSLVSGLFSTSRKPKSRRGDRSVAGIAFRRDSDSLSLSSARMSNPRQPKRRNFSMTGNSHLRPSPRHQRIYTTSPGLPATSVAGSGNFSMQDHLDSPGGLRITRSSAMKGPDAPAVELNNASIQHVRKLLSQLLADARVPHMSSWEKALMPILLRATDDVTPDVQNGDDMDIRHYVKLKKIPGGRPGDTSYVSGLVFSKNLALKSMPRSISHPNILILTFPLEYSRHKQHFMSLDLLIRQEREFLQNLVHRIAALRPQLLLCQKNISGLTLEFLSKANIATAYNIKATVLEAVSRCSQTRVITSVDKLAIKPTQAGRCASFYLKTYVYNKRRKTYMYLSGCPKELGCTIVLRGAEPEILRKLKRITEFMIFVVYNLKLETNFMRDEFALIPSYTGAGTIVPDKETKTSTEYVETKRSIAADVIQPNTEPRFIDVSRKLSLDEKQDESRRSTISTNPPKLKSVGTTESDDIPDDIPMPTFYGDVVEQYKDKILSASPFVRFMQPYLLIRAREQERRLVYLKRLLDEEVEEAEKDESQEIEPQKFALITPDMIHESVEGTSKKVREVLRAAQYAEYDKAVHNYRTQKKQWEAYITGNNDMFNPFTHQNITVLYSVVNIATGVPCAGPHLLSLGFYNEHETSEDFEADCTLGQYVEDLCLSANNVCFANGCEKRMFEHHRQYVHGSSQLSVTVEPHSSKLRGYEDIILMWSICRICGKETQVMPMSENTWKYSFGKYLELSFWSHDLHARAGLCAHDLHRNHLRFFGFKNSAIRLQYDSISLLEIVVPRTRITWKVVNDLNFKNDLFNKAKERVDAFFGSVKNRIESIKIESVPPERAANAKEEIGRLRKKADEEHNALITKLQDKYMGSRYYEVIPLNRAIRATQEKVANWDSAFADFDRNFFPSEKDITRLATLQLKKMFLDKDESVTSITSNEEGTNASISEGDLLEKTSLEESPPLDPQTRMMSPEKAHDMLTSVFEDHPVTSEDQPKVSEKFDLNVPEAEQLSDQTATIIRTDSDDIRHLDLAVPSVVQEESPASILSPSESRSISPTTTRKTPGSATPEPLESSETKAKHSSEKLGLIKETSSAIPRPHDGRTRRAGPTRSPPLTRTQSQPAHLRFGRGSSSDLSGIVVGPSTNQGRVSKDPGSSSMGVKPEKKLSERLGLSAIKSSSQSMIPRSIVNRRKESKVSSLAKHFEQLSREFEKERLRDRKQRATRTRQARAYPMKHSKPVIEIYRNVHDAVAEREPSDEDSFEAQGSSDEHKTAVESMAFNTVDDTIGEGFHAENTRAMENTTEIKETDDSNPTEEPRGSDIDVEGLKSDDEPSMLEIPGISESQYGLSAGDVQLDIKLELPKHEKKSLMNLLRNFWAERSASGWTPLEYVIRQTDHIFADSDVIIREDEPSSLIAFSLDSEDYKDKLKQFKENSTGNIKIDPDKIYAEDLFLSIEEQRLIEHSLLQSKGTHLKYVFHEGPARMTCKIFWAEQFDAVRRKCGVDDRIVECLSRCLKWDSKGGKTKSIFLKTLDDRIVLKSLSQVETQSFLKFAPAYFGLMGEALFHELPSAIAKMLGFYQIIMKNPATGTDLNLNVLVMENLFYDRSPARTFDLKGSMRNRRIQPTGEQNEVLLDENMVEFIYESPIFVREHAKRLLRSSVYNDTLFLARQNVMDYSLMVAIDESRNELVVGMIDCIRTYTWDKKVESWMKSGKNRPTVTSPKEYKSRFREAMNIYILQSPKSVPDALLLQSEKSS